MLCERRFRRRKPVSARPRRVTGGGYRGERRSLPPMLDSRAASADTAQQQEADDEEEADRDNRRALICTSMNRRMISLKEKPSVLAAKTPAKVTTVFTPSS